MRREIDKAKWGPFLDSLSTILSNAGEAARNGSLLIVRPVVRSAPVIGVTYDPKDDEVDVAFETIDHLVQKPVQIIVHESTDGLETVEVVDAEGISHVFRPCVPLPLPDEAP
jgi:hypothetical protein